jgi:cyclopropane-fatty-acyl-phospholipid synthase
MSTQNFKHFKKSLSLSQKIGFHFFCKHFSRWFIGQLHVTLPNGQEAVFCQEELGPVVHLNIKDNRFFNQVLWRGSIGFGHAYTLGYWDTTNLSQLLYITCLNRPHTDGYRVKGKGKGITYSLVGFSIVGMWLQKLFNRSHKNTLEGSSKNIQAHYDLGNALYKHFLDTSMTYSSGVYHSEKDTLEQAQQQKIQSIVKKLRLRPGNKVLEIGSGWGALAIAMAKETDCHVTSITLSKEQLKWARDRAKQEGLDHRISFELCDYRQVQGSFDRIVSIEMIEAVGHENMGTYLKTFEEKLSKNGLAVVQAITMPDSNYKAYKVRGDWIQRYIFPGAVVPSFEHIHSTLSKHTGLGVEEVDNIGLSYAKTLEDWGKRFRGEWETIRSYGWDNEFYNMWNYYLAYCEAGFRSKYLGTLQLTLARPQNTILMQESLQSDNMDYQALSKAGVSTIQSPKAPTSIVNKKES